MREAPLSHKYIKVGDRIGLMVKENISLDQMIETGGYGADSNTRQNYLGSRSRGNSRQSSREGNRNERYGNSSNRDRNRLRERTFAGNYRRDRSSSNDRARSGSRASTNRDRIRCYVCREYDHFARNCPNSREERDLEQLQHMLNMETRITEVLLCIVQMKIVEVL